MVMCRCGVAVATVRGRCSDCALICPECERSMIVARERCAPCLHGMKHPNLVSTLREAGVL